MESLSIAAGKARESSKLACDICGKISTSYKAYSSHKATHEPPKYKCEICEKYLSTKSSWNKHNQVFHNNKENHECSHCFKVFTTKHYLDRHIRYQHERDQRKVFKCDKCEYSVVVKTNLMKHIEAMHLQGRTKFKCTFCDMFYVRKTSLIFHVKKVHEGLDMKTVNCPHCEYKTARDGHLQQHINAVHLGLRPFKCDICGKDFTQKPHLKTHSKDVHSNVKDVRFYCDLCSKYFKTNQQLSLHNLRIHSNAKQLQCEECGKGLNTPQELKRHSYTHKENSERPFECQHCKRRFCTKSEHDKHLKKCQVITTVEQRQANFQDPKHFCEFCSKHFTRLKEHKLNMHSSNKRFKCEYCEFRGNSNQSMYRHSFHHKQFSERPLGCDDCDMRFIFNADLKEHLPRCKNKPK